MSAEDVREALGQMQLDAARRAGAGSAGDSSGAPKHAFWDTQPVPGLDEDTGSPGEEGTSGPIHPAEPSKVRPTPYNLPSSFEWADLDLADDAHASELYTLLTENYVEDGDAMFRFDYSVPFIRWAMTPPGYVSSWHVGVRVSQTKKLVAFIGATPADLLVHGARVEPGSLAPPGEGAADGAAEGGGGASGEVPAAASGAPATPGEQAIVEVNFLCVHKKLRSKRLAPVLIREVTRRVNLRGIFQACYTAGVVLPKPIARCRYWHRSLNPKKLVEIGFSSLAPRMTMVRTLKLYALPEAPQTKGIRAMREADVPACCAKLNEYLRHFAVAPQLSVAEFEHWLVTRTGVVYSFVVEDLATKEISDMVSFYSLPSTVLRHEKYNKLQAAYCYYYFANKTPLAQLLSDALVLAKRLDFDVFNALDILANDLHLKDLKFGIGDGHLQYYLYNWKCPAVTPPEVGLVLL